MVIAFDVDCQVRKRNRAFQDTQPCIDARSDMLGQLGFGPDRNDEHE